MRPSGKEIDELLLKLLTAESSNNPKAVGDNGKARGIAQIQQGTWEANTKYPWSTAFDEEKNVQTSRAILEDISNKYGDQGSIPKIAYTYNTGKIAKGDLPLWTMKHPNNVYREIFNNVPLKKLSNK